MTAALVCMDHAFFKVEAALEKQEGNMLMLLAIEGVDFAREWSTTYTKHHHILKGK